MAGARTCHERVEGLRWFLRVRVWDLRGISRESERFVKLCTWHIKPSTIESLPWACLTAIIPATPLDTEVRPRTTKVKAPGKARRLLQAEAAANNVCKHKPSVKVSCVGRFLVCYIVNFDMGSCRRSMS